LLAIHQEEKSIQNKQQLCIVPRHNDFEGMELNAHSHYATVQEEGAAVDIFIALIGNNYDRNDATEEEKEGE
jgi:hypothetical protein